MMLSVCLYVVKERGQIFDYEAADESDFRLASIMQLPTMHLDVVIVVPVVHANLNYQLPIMHLDVVFLSPQNIPSWVLYVNYSKFKFFQTLTLLEILNTTKVIKSFDFITDSTHACSKIINSMFKLICLHF